MITEEMLKNSSSHSLAAKKQGVEVKIVLTTEEVQKYLDSGKTSVSDVTFKADGRDYWFYTDDYCHGTGITWGNDKLTAIETCPSTTQISHQVVPRKGLEDGVVKNLKDFEFIYHYNDHQITKIEDYLKILNQNLQK